MRRPRLSALATVVTAAVVTVVLTGCSGGDDTDGGGGGALPSPSVPATGPPADDATDGNSTTSPDPSGDGTAGPGAVWGSGPLTVTHEVAVPPVPQMFRIRSAAHPEEGYDRVVFDFEGPLPGYQVRYVDEVREDGSDRPVTMPGRRFLLVTFTPAQAHTDAGDALLSPGRVTLDYPMLRGYVLVGDFEGHVSVALGLDDVVGFRVGELPGTPGRIYLDVAA